MGGSSLVFAPLALEQQGQNFVERGFRGRGGPRVRTTKLPSPLFSGEGASRIASEHEYVCELSTSYSNRESRESVCQLFQRAGREVRFPSNDLTH